jgi:DNA-binding NarL/FixJ family response regulator
LAEHPQTNVIALSSRIRDPLMLETLRAGFHGYFMKDISPEELMDDLMVIAQPRAAPGRQESTKNWQPRP